MAALFGRRLRRGATTTAVAAAAIAALSASQAPGVPASFGHGGGPAAEATDPSVPDTATGDSQYYTDLPPLDTPTPAATPGATGTGAVQGSAEAGIPASVLAAYKQAEKDLRESNPGCNLPWQLLAAIGKVESGQARGGEVDANGTTLHPILGPVLDGIGFADITDSDNGRYDQDTQHDRAVGPMQFIPTTWETWGRDANGDGVKDPNNIYDAALAAGLKLCAPHRDLSVQSDMNAAILSYNQSQTYLDTVLSWFSYYKKGTHEIPDGTGTLPTGPGPLDPEPSSTPPPSVLTTSPDPTTSPAAPHTPQAPHTPPASPSSPASGPGSSKPPADGGPTSTPSAPVLKQLVKTGGDTLSAVAGSLFGDRSSVKAVDTKGMPMAGVAVTFSLVGSTDARFDGGGTSATVTTGKSGVAEAPAVRAGETVGGFTLRAVAHGVPWADFSAKVTAHAADKLTVVGADSRTAAPEAAFEDAFAVKATLAGAAAGKVAVTASVLNADGTAPAGAGGPSFRKADGTLVKSVSGLRTDADGGLTLPALVAGKDEGTYLVKLTAVGGGSVTVTVKVVAPTAPADPPSGDPSTSPSASPSA